MRKMLFFKGWLAYILRFLKIVPLKLQKYIYFRGYFFVQTKHSKGFFLNNWGHSNFEIENKIFWNGIYSFDESISIQLWEKLAQSADFIIDIGANTGIYSLLAQATNPRAKVLAFEPIERVRKKLKANILLNKFPIETSNFAISDSDVTQLICDDLSIEHPYSTTLNKNFAEKIFSTVNTYEIETRTLDGLMLNYSVENSLLLIKVDVEQHEPYAIKGMLELIQNVRPIILIEILTQEIGDEIFSQIKNLNYDYFRIDEVKGLTKLATLDVIQSSSNRNFLLAHAETNLQSIAEYIY
jgi:FkbM family methyltransferase